MNNIGYREENSWCYFHPKQIVIGVCPSCLTQRLLILAAKQGQSQYHNHLSDIHSRSGHRRAQSAGFKPPNITLQKIFAFGSFFNRHELRQCKSDNSDQNDHDHASTTSQEDSFISIKFEENGAASWEKNINTVSNKVSLENCNNMSWNHHSLNPNKDNSNSNSKETKSVIEHGKPRPSLRWRKRIGHLFQLIRWKRSTTKGSVCHVSSKFMEGAKVRKGWMTKRK
ncbi:RNA polymerase sigma factor RpoD like [Quillaja saponaria]|uniref:RNA polymerase sigma factor RpoD like n=1 Tax=Quillaja saponaria TaxID=32244 RepID=A0AAD7LWG0_QUISA|nr:RNA polymerase sigma factor RpoD like [Quillaja saponaria]